MMESTLLLWLVFLPVIGAIFCLLFPEHFTKNIALAISIIGFGLGVVLYQSFNPAAATQFQMAVSIPWIEHYQVRFALAVDGLSLPLVVLTKLMVPIAILASWKVTRHQKAFMACYLILDSAMTGTFLATDIFLFYVFWELMLIPMVLIIGVWGSTERIYASIKFFLFTFAGSVLMLVAIFWIYLAHVDQFGYYSAEITSFYRLTFSSSPVFMGLGAEQLVFLGLFIAFAIKVPLFPFHTWLPDAHVQAPAGGSILLAAVLLKMGIYGLLRFCIPICPNAFLQFLQPIIWLSLVGIFYGAWVAFQQTDLKKLVAYSSVSHLGFVVLGLCAMNPEALTGAMLQMVNHGISTGALFLLVGILYQRRHSQKFSDLGGLAKQMPWFAVFLVLASCSSMGVPGLNGFIGEFLILFGTFQVYPIIGGVATIAVIFTAVYMLTMLKKVLFGPLDSEENKKLSDLDKYDWAAIVPLALLIFWLGVYPQPFIDKFKVSMDNYWASVQQTNPTRLADTFGEEKNQ